MGGTIIVEGDKTLGEGDDGSVQCVEAAVTIVLPHEKTWRFAKGDEFTIVSNANGVVKVEGEKNIEVETGVFEDVKVIPLPNASITSKGSAVKVKYEGNNTYLMWGSL